MGRSVADLIANKTVIPVIQIEHRDEGVPLAKALIAGGITVLEVTLRSDAALDAARDMIAACPDALVGIGTVLDRATLDQAVEIGAGFIVSPGTTPDLLAAARDAGIPYLPGVATASEVMAARAMGCSSVKLFPAGVVGGVAMLKALAPVFPDVKFCPTGGVSADNLESFLGLDNVFAVGGSWLAPKDVVAAGDWAEITRRARAASTVMDQMR